MTSRDEFIVTALARMQNMVITSESDLPASFGSIQFFKILQNSQALDQKA